MSFSIDVLCRMVKVKEFIQVDPAILSGNPVFKGTRVPVQCLFDHLEKGISLDEFLEDFPSVTKEQVIAVLEIAGKLLSSENISKIYENSP
ncbi:MAG: DUF433 domain-containing protein [Cyclobacteriaceae bacterium]